MMEPQVAKTHYEFERYCYPDRWASYYHQIREILATAPTSVLEVGAGDNVVRHYVEYTGVKDYKTLDIAADLSPDIVAPITAIPLPDKSVDTVCAFEVLEHLPFDQVPQALAELARVARNKVLISVPHFGPPIKVFFKIPFLPAISFLTKVPYPKTHVFNGQHYWELGKRGYPPARLRAPLNKQFVIEKEFVPWDNTYHHFFILTPR